MTVKYYGILRYVPHEWCPDCRGDGCLKMVDAVSYDALAAELAKQTATANRAMDITDRAQDRAEKAETRVIELEAALNEIRRTSMSDAIINIAIAALGSPAETQAEPVFPVPSGWRGATPWFHVGDRVLPFNALHRWYPVHTVTKITDRGFEYTHDEISLRPGQWSVGGETYEPSAYRLAAFTNDRGEK